MLRQRPPCAHKGGSDMPRHTQTHSSAVTILRTHLTCMMWVSIHWWIMTIEVSSCCAYQAKCYHWWSEMVLAEDRACALTVSFSILCLYKSILVLMWVQEEITYIIHILSLIPHSEKFFSPWSPLRIIFSKVRL